jgi:hypothetical protein
MTLFYSHRDRLRDPAGTRLRVLARRAIGRLGAVLRIVHQSIIAAKTNRLRGALMLRDEWPLGPNPDQHDPGQDAAKFPQCPLIIGDKWDF